MITASAATRPLYPQLQFKAKQINTVFMPGEGDDLDLLQTSLPHLMDSGSKV